MVSILTGSFESEVQLTNIHRIYDPEVEKSNLSSYEFTITVTS